MRITLIASVAAWIGYSMLSTSLFAANAAPRVECAPVTAGGKCRIVPTSLEGAYVGSAVVLATPDTERALGLVTVGFFCSGTLINRYWVLTADHCISQAGLSGGAVRPLNFLPITATWSNRTVIPTRIVRWGTNTPWTPTSASPHDDLALLFLGAGDFGEGRTQLLYPGQVWTAGPSYDGSQIDATWLVVYGRGIHTLATASPLTQSISDGRYRWGRYDVDALEDWSFTIMPNIAGQILAGGDSGGPHIVVAPNFVMMGIAGVQSTCFFKQVSGQPKRWEWAESVSSCSAAALFNYRDEIVAMSAERPRAVTAAAPIYGPRALYSVAHDVPLVAPASTTQGLPLVFATCQWIVRCPVGPAYNLWRYDEQTREIRYSPQAPVGVATPSCLTTTMRNVGLPIVLAPCNGRTAQRWTITLTMTRHTTQWRAQNDLNRLCLHADPPTAGNQVTIPKPAQLVQRPCEPNSDHPTRQGIIKAQRFTDADADWIRKNNP